MLSHYPALVIGVLDTKVINLKSQLLVYALDYRQGVLLPVLILFMGHDVYLQLCGLKVELVLQEWAQNDGIGDYFPEWILNFCKNLQSDFMLFLGWLHIVSEINNLIMKPDNWISNVARGFCHPGLCLQCRKLGGWEELNLWLNFLYHIICKN